MKTFTTTRGYDLGPFGFQVLEFHGRFYPGSPGNMSGPPDRWEQGHAAEVEIEYLYLVDGLGQLTLLPRYLPKDAPQTFFAELAEQVESELEQEGQERERD